MIFKNVRADNDSVSTCSLCLKPQPSQPQTSNLKPLLLKNLGLVSRNPRIAQKVLKNVCVTQIWMPRLITVSFDQFSKNRLFFPFNFKHCGNT